MTWEHAKNCWHYEPSVGERVPSRDVLGLELRDGAREGDAHRLNTLPAQP